MTGDRTSAHYLVAGLDVGLSQRSVDFSRLQWGTQHDGNGGFDPSLNSFEDFSRENFIFGDVGVGLLWFSTLDRNTSFYIGAAAHHINRPNQSFFEEENVELYARYTLHAGGEFAVGDKVSLVPGVVSMFQGPSFQLNLGTSVRFDLGSSRYDNQSFQFGLWGRLVNNYQWGFNQDVTPPEVTEDTNLGVDALILSARFDYNQFGIGFSYDINVSDLRPASNSNGAFEFSLIYTICGPERRALYCPNF
jgi:type IX secretion system PorP/SprF family membrane protein